MMKTTKRDGVRDLKQRTATARRARRLTAALGAVGATVVLMSAAEAAPAPTGAAAVVGHAYRHGLVPMVSGAVTHGTVMAACSAKCLHFGSGVSGVGVTTGKEKVYLVFWGSQWGTQGKNSNGYATFTGDSKGVAPDLQAFLTGLGNGGELWSGVMTQ
jgi:hypothetical protein